MSCRLPVTKISTFKKVPIMKKSLLLLALFAVAMSAGAAKLEDGPSADCEGLRIATGPLGKGYSKQFADIKKIAGSKLSVCEVTTEGGLDNLNTLSTKGADVGIVPVDALRQMAPGDDNIAALQVVAVLNNNYLHVVTNANGVTYAGEKKYMGLSKEADKLVLISRFSQLKGATVAATGSAQLLVRQLDKQLSYGMRIVDVSSDAAAFEMVKKGQVLAAFSVSGWPSGTVGALKQDSGLTLVPFDAPIQGSYTVKPFSYKKIGAYNVQALSVQNVLVTRPFSGMKIQEVSKLKAILSDNLSDLKDGAYEPAWNEIKSLDSAIDWPKFNGGAAKAKK